MRAVALILLIVSSCTVTRPSESSASISGAVTPSSRNVAHYHGCPVFTQGDWYNAPVAKAKVEPNSARYVDSMQQNGDNGGFVVYAVNPAAYRVNLATKHTPTYHVYAVSYHQNEFPLPLPWQSDFFIEGEQDGHAIVLDTDNCMLSEFYQATFSGGRLSAYSGWTWDLRKPLSSPGGAQPSSTASGLPLFAGLLKGEEIESTAPIDHALNFAPPVGSLSPSAFVAPATNTGGCDGCSGPPDWPMPYGAHLRLRAQFQLNCGSSCPQAQRIAQALKTYGAYISDTGSRGTGNQLYVALDALGNDPWNAGDLANLEQIHIGDMELLPLGLLTRK